MGLPSTEPARASVIVSNFNYARFLRAAIDSALSQTYDNCEVVVVDDGSTDNSREVVESYGRRVKAIYKRNGGQGSALNAGFEASNGDVIIFLDADDVLLPHAVEVAAAQMGEGVALVRYPLEVIDGAGEPSGRYVGGSGSRLPSAMLGPFGVDSPGSAKAFPRKILGRIMPVPEEDWTMGADAFLAALSSVLGEVVCLEKALGKYRIHGQNHVAGVKLELAEIRRDILCDFNLHASLQKLTRGEIGSLEEWLSGYPQHWVGRMMSLREGRGDHPWDDTIVKLLVRGLAATLRHPYWNLRRKFAYAMWVTGYAIAPKRIARTLKAIEGRGGNRLPRLLFGR